MKILKKIRKAIAKKFKNWKGTTASKETATQEPNTSSSKDFLEEPEENILIAKTAMEQQPPTVMIGTATNIGTTTCGKNIEKALKDNHSVTTTKNKDATSVTDKAVDMSTDTELCENTNKNSENLDNIGKPSTKVTRQRQAILAGIVGAVLLVGSIVSYILKMHVIAVIGGIAGLVCMSFVLYNILKPNTQLEKVKSIEHPIASFESEGMIKNP